MFGRWSDVLSGIATVLAAVYVGLEIVHCRRRLRDIFDMLDNDGREVSDDLEGLIESGKLRPFGRG